MIIFGAKLFLLPLLSSAWRLACGCFATEMSFMYRRFQKKSIFKNGTLFKFCNFNIKSWSIVFFGSDYYSLFALKALHKEMMPKYISHIEVVVVNDKSPVYNYSTSKGIKTHFWPPDLTGNYDFGVIASFGKMIPQTMIELFPLGILNVHASLLPKYRGGMPIVHAVKNGEKVTGVTVTKIMPDKFDVGEIILQKPCIIGEEELMPSLYQRLTYLACECLLEVISNLPKCLESGFPQLSTEASYAPKLTKEHSVVKWSEMTALEVFNLYRALFGTFELRSTFKEQPIRFACISLDNSDSKSSAKIKEKLEPGCFTYSKLTRFFHVQCKDTTIAVCTVKYRNRMYKSSAFLSGYLKDLSKNLWKFES